jgi:hypothetical protein
LPCQTSRFPAPAFDEWASKGEYQKLSNKSLYYEALERLSDDIPGSSDFEKISRLIVKFMYPDHNFEPPEGGQGTKDGGYDGRDPIKKAKLACSTNKNYEKKIKDEVAKSKGNGDLEIIYFSNQAIPEPIKIDIEKEILKEGIKLYISGIVKLSEKIEEHLENNNNEDDIELYNLLELSFLKVGEYYKRSEVIPFNDINIDRPYKKKVIINNKNSYGSYSEEKTSDNPLLEFILLCLTKDSKYVFNNICICGIGYLGKSYLMKSTFNHLINEFSNKNNYKKYKILPFILFFELKYYSTGSIRNLIKNNIDPLFIFLDGLDELSETTRNELNSEIHSILRVNKHINFIISGRNSSFTDFEILYNSYQLNLIKFIDYDDIELMELIYEYKNTPLEDLLPIPMYRNYVLEKRIPKNTNIYELYGLLVRDNFKKDKERRDYSSKITSRTNSEEIIDIIINSVSEFCYNLFINNKRVFSEIELKKHFSNSDHFIFIIYSSIIDYRDENQISFISNFYFEYFIANAFLNKEKETLIKIFFQRDKIYVPNIDILMIFLNMAKTNSLEKYKYIIEKIKKESFANILLSEFDLIPDKERYKYFKLIFSEYKKKNFWIYYGRFTQMYGALKNIDSMTQRMQLLLPDKYKLDAVIFLKKEIISFIKHPTKRYVMSFGNALCLLMPPINNNLWTEAEQDVLKDLSIKLIKFFLYNDLSRELNSIMSERFIFDWYHDFKWTTGWDQYNWEQFYKDISGNSCILFSEIFDELEFTIKYNIFRISHEINKQLFFPLFRYIIKNKYMDGHSMAAFVPELITDDYETPMIRTDDRIDDLIHFLKERDISIAEIIDLLNYAIEKNVYNLVKDSYNNPIKHLEEILFQNINLIIEEDFDRFTKYYFGIYEFDFDYRLFPENEIVLFIDLAWFLINEIIKREFYNWNTGFFLHRLINFSETKNSIQYLNLICEKMPKSVYARTVDYIYKNPKHILHNNEFVIIEYKYLFKDEIERTAERDKKIEEVKKEMEKVKETDLLLIQDTDKMITEIKSISNFLLSSEINNEHKTKFGGLFTLYHKSILHMLMYSEKKYNIPVFSECAIRILEDFYREDILDIDTIIKRLREYLYKKENFYSYFYYCYINKLRNIDAMDMISIMENLKNDKNLIYKIIETLNMDMQEKFLNRPIEFFEYNFDWLMPFFFYYKTLLNNNRPEWMQDEHILKLIVIPDPAKIGPVIISTDLTLDWMIEMFPTITKEQIVEYGLKIINNINNRLSRVQIVKYFISYLKSTDKDELTDKIIEFIIYTTKTLFEIESSEHKYSEFQYIATFWRECDINFIDVVFPKFTVKIITSVIKKDNKDVDYQYRKDVLLYCCRVADADQKKRIIDDIDTDTKNKVLSNKVRNEIQCFLASFGKEESVKYIIRAYLHGKDIPSRYSYNNYPIGFIKVNNKILKDYINLFFYSTAKSSERRNILYSISQTGIKQHLNKNNFYIFKKRMEKEIKKQTKLSNWKSESYNSYLLQMEQSVLRNSLC